MAVELVRPRFEKFPRFAYTFGPEVARLGEIAEFVPDPEQRLLLDVTFGYTKRHRIAAPEVCTIAARQNLKTGFLKLCGLGWLIVDPQPFITWSAHEYDTASASFQELAAMLEGNRALRRRVKRIYHGDGKERIVMKREYGGAVMKFKARTKGGGRGLTAARVILDEAFALQPAHMGALVPIMSAMPNGQMVEASSSGRIESESLRDIRDRGRAGDPELAYAEWSAPEGTCEFSQCDHSRGMKGCALDDEKLYRLANPALGRRIEISTIRRERRQLPVEEFARERLGWWDKPTSEIALFAPEQWAAGADLRSEIRDDVVIRFGLATSWNRARGAIGTAGLSPSGKVHLEVVECHALQSPWDVDEGAGKRGIVGLIAAAKRLSDEYDGAEFMVDPRGPAAWLIPKLKTADVPLYDPEPDDDENPAFDPTSVAAAIVDLVESGQIAHLDDQNLNAAVAGAQRKPAGDRYVIGRAQSTFDTCPLEAVAMPAWLVTEDDNEGWVFTT